MYSKEFNNCYILLSNISQALENTKFIVRTPDGKEKTVNYTGKKLTVKL